MRIRLLGKRELTREREKTNRSVAISSKPGKGETNNSVMLMDIILMIS